MNHSFSIKKENVILKALDIADIELLRCLRNKEENRECFLYSDIISYNQQITWYNNYLNKENDYMFSIFKKDKPQEFIGAVALYDINVSNAKSEFGRIILDKEKVKEKGFGLTVTLAICDFGFEILGLKLIFLEVFEDNIAALKTYERAGFIKIGEEVVKERILIKMQMVNKKHIINN